ncbi:MAG: hypothetical protein WC012_02510 [Thiohalomonadaceae bacterium]
MTTRTRLSRLVADACIVLTGLWLAAAGFSGGDVTAVLAALGIA